MADEPSAQRMALYLGQPGSKSFLDLPDDVVADILLRLPFKTILSLAAVNTTFLKIIKDPTFVHRQLSHSVSKLAAINKNGANNDTVGFILITRMKLSEKLNFSVFRDDRDSSFLRLLDIPFQTSSRTIRIIGSCNGLLCLTPGDHAAFGREVYLCNPVLRKCMKLNSDFSCFVDLIQNNKRTYPVLGFGYHEAEEDYRVVRLIYNKSRPRAEIYSLREKRWRSIRAIVTTKAVRYASPCVDGRIYWIGTEFLDSPASRLIWFDLKDEVFGEMKLPVSQASWVSMGVMRWGDKVTVYSIHPGVEGPPRCVFWVQQTSDIGEIFWVKVLTFLLTELGWWPVGFTWTRKLLFASLDENLSLVFNLEDNKYSFLGLHGPYTVDTRFMESLALFQD